MPSLIRKLVKFTRQHHWRGPAKDVRFDLRLIEQREWVLENCDWAGGYLYKKMNYTRAQLIDALVADGSISATMILT